MTDMIPYFTINIQQLCKHPFLLQHVNIMYLHKQILQQFQEYIMSMFPGQQISRTGCEDDLHDLSPRLQCITLAVQGLTVRITL